MNARLLDALTHRKHIRTAKLVMAIKPIAASHALGAALVGVGRGEKA
jgi:hypothetical protein